MTTNIYLARLLAEEREHDFRQYAEARQAHRASLPAREQDGSWLARLFHHHHSDDVTHVTNALA
jgi:hypothetical protein